MLQRRLLLLLVVVERGRVVRVVLSRSLRRSLRRLPPAPHAVQNAPRVLREPDLGLHALANVQQASAVSRERLTEREQRV